MIDYYNTPPDIIGNHFEKVDLQRNNYIFLPDINKLMIPSDMGGLINRFSRDYWVANTLEFFQKGAFFGMLAVLGVHIVKNLHISGASWGIIFGIIIALVTFIPLVSGALAEKYGYKSILIMSFLLMILGFFLLGYTNDIVSLLIAVVIVGFGAGTFSPIVSATITHITFPEQRNYAYSIHYWMVNLGAFLFPLVIGLFITTRQLFFFVFFISVILIVINLIITLLAYSNPIPTRPELDVSAAISKILPALKDNKFVILLIIYSGFWFMDAIHMTFLPLYMIDFAKMPEWFSVLFLAAIHPGTIIILGPFIGDYFKKYDSLKAIILGLFIFCLGIMVVAFSFHSFIFITGIVIFSIAEFIIHPNFISYVSKFTPTDKVAIYMGCIFIPMGVGEILGGIVQGQWYELYAVSGNHPKIFLANVAAVGIITIAAFIAYNRWRFEDDVRIGEKHPSEGGVLVKPYIPVLVIIIAPLLILGGFAGGSEMYLGTRGSSDGDSDMVIEEVKLGRIVGTSMENSDIEEIVDIPEEEIISVTFTLKWEDEQDSGVRYTNEPDQFQLKVEDPYGNQEESAMESNPQDGLGEVSITFDYSSDDSGPERSNKGKTDFLEYSVTIICGSCGDQSPIVDITGLRTISDDSNSWILSTTYECLKPPPPP